MLLPVRKPFRPEPLPLRERSPSDPRPSHVWVSVRVKRHRPTIAADRTLSPARRALSAPRG
jgi:hypothetical protein